MVRFGALVLFVAGAASTACDSDDGDPSGQGGTGGDAGQSGKGGGAGSGGSGRAGSSSGAAGRGGASGGDEAGSGGEATAGAPDAPGGQAGADGGGSSGSDGSGAVGPLPEGNTGIASRHPRDDGLANDPEVIFFDNFERYSEPHDLDQTYDAVYQYDQIRLASERDNVYEGTRSLEFTLPQQDEELSNATDKVLEEERDILFLRYYSKFMGPFDVVGSSHNGASISAHYFVNGNATPGVPADGSNKFLVAYENWRGDQDTHSPGFLNAYVYHPEQRDDYGDHFFPTGLVMPNTSLPFDFGPDFVPRDDITPELDRWYCYEFMVKANTPGERDGRIAFWLDGTLLADFQNLRLRDVPELKIDRFGVSFHVGSNPNGVARKWFDNVVAAKAYIGPFGIQ